MTKGKFRIICKVCNKEIFVPHCRLKTKSFCSKICANNFKKGKRVSCNTEFKKGEHRSPKTEFKKGIKHTEKWKENMRGKTGEKSISWKGGKRITKSGYVYIYKPKHPFTTTNKTVFEHRLIVEKQIGRYLLPEETTHHLNEIRDDNRPENLMAFTSKSAHIRFHKNPDNVKSSEIIFDGRKL